MDREVRDFKERHGLHLPQEIHPAEKDSGSAEETVGEHQTEPSPVPPVAGSDPTDATNPLPSAQAPDPGNVQVLAEKDPLEENGEVIVEGDEDTVIY